MMRESRSRPSLIGAEQEHRAVFRRAEQVDVHLPEAPELVGIAPAEEADRLRLRGIDRVDASETLQIEAVGIGIDVGADEAALVHQVDRLGGRIEEIAVPLGLVVGCDHLHEGYEGVEGEQDESRCDRHPVAPELPPHQLPGRGAVEALVLGADGLGLTGIEWRGIDVMALGGDRGVHRPPPIRMRGSSPASSRSEISMPTTVSTATNMRMKPARN